jgi:hypothetical protein
MARWYADGQSLLKDIFRNLYLNSCVLVECQRSKGNCCLSFVRLSFTRIHRLKRALERVDAGPGGRNMVYWTSLREVRSNESF